jgi:arylsulfatase A-like enzyme
LASDRRPSIIVFFSDQQRWDTCGCYGQRMPVTPNLDQMAAEGVRFEHAFTCQPVCGPARACLQTGKYATEVGCYRNDIALPVGERTLANWFSDAGYEVGYIGKWHLASTGKEHNYTVSAVPPDRRGGYKDYWLASDVLEFTSHGYDGHFFDGEGKQVDFKGYRADCQTDFVLEYLRTRDGQRPFFLFVSYIEPHHQNDHHRFEGPNGSKERFAHFDIPPDLADTAGDWRENYPDYLGCCASLDHNLGRVRAELQRLGQLNDTLVMYTSDHACHFCTRNGEYKRSCHDDSIRVPMVACGPGFRGGRVISDELVSLMDVPPTLLAAGGVAKPATMHGRPLQELVEGRAQDWPQEAFVQISESQIGRAVRTKRWTYSVKSPTGGDHPASELYREEYLYDLDNDPYQKRNLVGDAAYAGVRAELAVRLKRRMAEAGEKEPRILPAEG